MAQNLDIVRKPPDLNGFINRNNAILDEFMTVYKEENQPSSSEVHGTSIPFVYNLLGSWIMNPSTVSISTFQRMSYSDSVISSSLEYNTSIISNTIGDYYHKNKKIEKFVRTALDRLEGGKAGLIRDMLSAMWAGFYTGEKQYSRPSEYIDGKIWIKSIIAFPPSTVLFRVNRAGQLDEFIYQYCYFAQNPGIQNSLSYLTPGNSGLGMEFADQYGGGYNVPVDSLAFTGDADFPLRTTTFQTVGLIPIPREKCVHFVRKGQDGFLNPYGRSMLRSAYNFYVLKCAYLQFLAIAGDRKSTPLLVGYADPNAMTTGVGVDLTNPNPSVTNNNAAQMAIQTLRNAVSCLHGDSALLLPGMKGQAFEIEAVDIGANLNLFIDCLKYCDDSMQQSLLIPASMFSGGAGASYALGTSQASIHNKLLSSTRNEVMKTMIRDIVSDLIKMNFEESDYDNDLGYFEAELLNIEDKTNLIKQYEVMVNSGLTAPGIKEDINRYRQMLGDKELTDKEIKELQDFVMARDIKSEKDTTNKTDVKSTDSHYKKRDTLKGGTSA